MAQPGDVLKSPAAGRMVFRKTASSTGGDLLEMEVTYRPSSAPPPPHYHPAQEEHFEIVKGSMCVHLGEAVQTYQAGEQFVVPAGVSHSMYNLADEDAVVIWQVRPALKTEALYETLWGLAADGKTDAKGKPKLLQAAVIGWAFKREFRQSAPPYRVMWIVLALLSVVGRLAGYRAVYPQYSHEGRIQETVKPSLVTDRANNVSSSARPKPGASGT